MPVSRVTEVIDYLTEPELLAWMLRTPKARRDASSDDAKAIGTLVDKTIQDNLFPPKEFKEVDIPEKYQIPYANCMNAWAKFKVDRPDVVETIRAIQLEVRNSEMNVLGHPDILCESKDRWGIIDIKTSKQMYPRYWTQTAIYSELWKLGAPDSTYYDKSRFLGILRLDKESGLPHYLEIEDEGQIQYEVDVFLAYKKAFDHNVKVRDFIRQQLEEEVFPKPKRASRVAAATNLSRMLEEVDE